VNNPRTIHLLLGGHNVGKTTFARFLQIGKHNIYRISVDELMESTGAKKVDWFYALCHLFLVHGDLIIDDVIHNKSSIRKQLINDLTKRDLEFIIYAYVVKRPVDHCFDEFYDKEDIIDSHNIEFPKLIEGIDKILSVTWEESRDAVSYGGEMVAIKPKIEVIEEAPPSVIVRSKKKIVKNKLKRGKQNILIPRPKDGK
jgi:adenylate kinase family enzyme